MVKLKAMTEFKLATEYEPSGDQPQAIEALVSGINRGLPNQVLLGVTGSGKTFTMAHVIARLQRPSLVLACLLYTSPSPRDRQKSRMPSSA